MPPIYSHVGSSAPRYPFDLLTRRCLFKKTTFQKKKPHQKPPPPPPKKNHQIGGGGAWGGVWFVAWWGLWLVCFNFFRVGFFWGWFFLSFLGGGFWFLFFGLGWGWVLVGLVFFLSRSPVTFAYSYIIPVCLCGGAFPTPFKMFFFSFFLICTVSEYLVSDKQLWFRPSTFRGTSDFFCPYPPTHHVSQIFFFIDTHSHFQLTFRAPFFTRASPFDPPVSPQPINGNFVLSSPDGPPIFFPPGSVCSPCLVRTPLNPGRTPQTFFTPLTVGAGLLSTFNR